MGSQCEVPEDTTCVEKKTCQPTSPSSTRRASSSKTPGTLKELKDLKELNELKELKKLLVKSPLALLLSSREGQEFTLFSREIQS